MTSSPILYCQVYLNPGGINMIKDKNGKDLREAEEIRKRWQEYPDELYNIYLNDLDNHNGVVTHPEQDILECEVKWSLTSKHYYEQS